MECKITYFYANNPQAITLSIIFMIHPGDNTSNGQGQVILNHFTALKKTMKANKDETANRDLLIHPHNMSTDRL